MTGYLTAIAWSDFKDDSEDSEREDEEKGKENPESFVNPSLSIPGVMGWLTGVQHKAINREKLRITASFDHECLQKKSQAYNLFP